MLLLINISLLHDGERDKHGCKSNPDWDDQRAGPSFPTRYPEAKQFTPMVGTCVTKKKKKSISWNRPWNMSAVAEGALAVLRLVVWAWKWCVVRCTPWVVWGGLHPDSRAVAARAHLSAPGKERRSDPLMTSGPCCQRAADCKWPPLNVTKGAICIQLPRWHCRGNAHGRTASGQMGPKPVCVTDGLNVYAPVYV